MNRPRRRQETNIENTVCLGKTTSLCHKTFKQHLSNIWGSIREKGKQHWGWVEK